MIDLIFVSWNRLAYTRLAFRALVMNTAWEHVGKLVLADDASSDGTREWLDSALDMLPAGVPAQFLPAPFGGPVAAVNAYLRGYASPGAEVFGKIDNDTMVPPGWLPELLSLMERHPEVDLLGMRPDIGPPEDCPYAERRIEVAPFVDGNGLWRHRAFAGRALPQIDRRDPRKGMWAWQQAHPEVRKAWAAPDLPVFQLDGLPFEPWLSIAAAYREKGWQRGWPNAPYSADAGAYWQWAGLEAAAA